MFKHFPFIHNHGDFVHLDALREWFRGVPSLDTFLKYKNDKAIVKDMHFTDEKTTVEYIDTTDDTKKESTLCEYLTSDVFDENNNSQFKKVDKIRFKRYPNQEKVITVHQKDDTTGNYRDVIRSNVPVAYDATDDFLSSNHATHFGVFNYGIKIYDDDYNKTSLPVKKVFNFGAPIAYNATDDYDNSPKAYYLGVNENGIKIYNTDTKEVVQRYDYKHTSSIQEISLDDCNPFDSITGRNVENDIGELGLNKGNSFHGLQIGNTIVNGQIMYEITGDLHIGAGKFVELMFTPGSMGSSHFASNVYPKNVQCLNNQGLITSITKNSTFPLNNSTPTYVTIYNPSTRDVAIQYLHFTF